MAYQKIVNLLDNASNQPSRFRTNSSIETNDQPRRMYDTNSDITFKITMLKFNLCYYSDAYIFIKGRKIITGAGPKVEARKTYEMNKGVVFKNCAPFANCKNETNNTKIDNAKDISIVMRICNLIE